MHRVSGANGFVVSIEGEWGSGKTTILHVVEKLLTVGANGGPPVIVHFNPWLIGEREALLKLFISTLADAVDQSDPLGAGKRAAEQLRTYAKAFDVLKLIPGAEPWASLMKQLLETMGNAVGAIAEHKTPDLEKSKHAVAEKLREFDRRVIVFIDDMDRLYPKEVFEMVRIIKAVGDLPNVGYVIAWDPKYVQDALSGLNVPQAGTYLDKIINVRLPMPVLSARARDRLMKDALGTLPEDVHAQYFTHGEESLQSLYHNGLRDLLEYPRDFSRVFAIVHTLEPSLRGEIVLGDIIALAAVMVTASPVFRINQ